MEKIPLIVRLKRELHRRVAYAQDLIVEEVYKEFNHAVLHGGTGIWRCYGGKRFSEDLDFYVPKQKEKLEKIFQSLEKKGFKILKKKISETSVYSELELNRTHVRLEATYQQSESILVDYEAADGNSISIYSLTPEMFIQEKIKTYNKRRKVRDVWDVFFLLKLVKNLSSLKNELKGFIDKYKPPFDEADLKVILVEGVVPSAEEMKEYIRRKWENASI